MSRTSWKIGVAFLLSGVTAGCAGEPPAPSAARSTAESVTVTVTDVIAADEVVERDDAAENQARPQNLQEQSAAVSAPVTVKYVIDPSGSPQLMAPVGFQSASSSAPLPGARRRPRP
jgi:hypothetical protein